ncbi:hypothetical protein PENANT_c007G08348 [Penicillium antarcticum]|uniref:SET domain-containing protein n=1 Tax=Penicillium antarcticum TaxID=416450 RepID=A0A1V6QCP3_9EURO|nr:uncharacterized protein N7508_003640 [Penicillium antarcticum]KAJ5312810.1 hypothetical protein N7508_003640 [Penicillium antarcticum]OQD86802.1 hypothetical protein PENANT_c007G08348 [Penicillium antarcticum]
MDTYNVSNVPAYLRILNGHKQSLKNARNLKGRPASSEKSRNEILMQFSFRRLMSSQRQPKSSVNIRSSFLPLAYTPCTTSFKDLNRVMIKDLCLETHHRGTYVLLRTITPTDTLTAAMVIVEDEEESVLMLQLYNQGQELSGRNDLNKGTVIVVKEPYVKVMSDGDYGLRVDHLSDVKFIPEFDSLVPLSWRRKVSEADESSNSWKLKGNDFFNKASYRAAIECYTEALNSHPSSEVAVATQLNRALTFLKTHRFDAALLDVEEAACAPSPSEKALFRKAQALYNLQRFQESCEAHKLLRERYPKNSSAAQEFKRASARLDEQTSGEYKFRLLHLEARKRQPPHLDRGSFIGPVSVQPTKSHGRGLFTIEAVKAGDLLFCEKAFAHAFHDAKSTTHDLNLLINAQSDTMTLGTQAELIELAVQRLYKNPSVLPAFIDLHHGAYKPVAVQEIDGIPIVDTFLVGRIIQLNCFGCPLSSRESHMSAMRNDETAKKSNEQFHSCGIWRLASYVNHSCFSNARRSFIGDMMVVRATKDLAPGTELTFWYKSPFTRDSKGDPMDLGHWGFECDCAICQEIQKTDKTVMSKRTRLEADLQKLFNLGAKHSSRIEKSISGLAETYTQLASVVPRLALWKPCLSLAAIFAASHKPKRTVEFGLKALESLGYVIDGGKLPHAAGTPLSVKEWGLMTDGVVGCWMILSGAYETVAPGLEAQAKQYARISYRICVGEDSTFEETYGKLSQRPDGFLETAQ